MFVSYNETVISKCDGSIKGEKMYGGRVKLKRKKKVKKTNPTLSALHTKKSDDHCAYFMSIYIFTEFLLRYPVTFHAHNVRTRGMTRLRVSVCCRGHGADAGGDHGESDVGSRDHDGVPKSKSTKGDHGCEWREGGRARWLQGLNLFEGLGFGFKGLRFEGLKV